jgi:ATP-dependent DNA helicase RecG
MKFYTGESAARMLEILEQLRRGPNESTTVEFKSNLSDPKAIGEYIAALANSAALDGHARAWIVWGVEDGSHAVKGTSFDPFNAKGEGNQSLVMWLQQMTSPKADFSFHAASHPDGKVILLEIHPARSAPIAFQGTRFIRVDSHKVKLSAHADKEARLWEALGAKEDWTGEIVSGATFDDLDPNAIDFARARFTEYLIRSEPETDRHERIRTEAVSWDVPTFLNKAHVTKQGRITRAALLLLGKDESASYLAPADVKISWILRDADNKAVTSQHFGLPFLRTTEDVFRRIRNLQIEHMPDGSLFPTPVSQYDPWVIREALHNCIAHQDYGLGGKVNVVEHPDRLVFTNLGSFLPPSVEWMLEHQSPPEHYRNQWLIDAMVRLRMIDQIGSGIRRMYETQRERFFPLPDFVIDTDSMSKPRVEVTISGKILDTKYTQALMHAADLDLREVLLLDRVQKGQRLTAKEAKSLRAAGLIEGRAPSYLISSKVADWTAQKAKYIHNRGFDDGFYKQLVIEYLQKYDKASRKELDDLLLPKLPEVLDADQKAHKIKNLLQALRRARQIENKGTRGEPDWRLVAP